ncbi:lytic transglycosylase domain-containing protein [Sphingomonas ginkgonis]|uniref:Lytic transglycosylase domain-containing protein n=1 Tax=Sphingomonas ginkgonis TaxID=2315330 RepID=A0A429VB33_9SPHN|nr:lytic transglycosylase domain-containing protein [Sphingomonas ginkgonis]RST31037.1 lytic transglycosylase domain-containing protein [Sphingomonas ginkgonis]
MISLLLAATVLQSDPLAPLPETPPAAKAAPTTPPILHKPLRAVPVVRKPAALPPAESTPPADAPAGIDAQLSSAPPQVVAPVPPPPPVRVVVVPKDWKGVFVALRQGDWASAQAGIAALPPSPLTLTARAELALAKNSPRTELGPLMDLLLQGPEMPQAAQVAKLAQLRGADDLPPIQAEYRPVLLGSAPKRTRAKGVIGEPAADALRLLLDPLVKVDDYYNAEQAYNAAMPTLSYEARAEASQRIAWIYYVIGQDAQAKRVADAGRYGATGEWGVQAAWVSGLASWRQNDCNSASLAFRDVARLSTDREMAAAGSYWASRSEMACRRPQAVEGLLKSAAASSESFYGLVARRTLGMATNLSPSTSQSNARVDNLPNVQRAVLLAGMGEYSLAEAHLRHQAMIGSPADQPALIAVAKRLNLPGAQFWLAHFGIPGAQVSPADRFPVPNWSPAGGWRIDPALAFAHARQETNFRYDAVSPANAVGLMQVLPSTAALLARRRGGSVGNLYDPATNIEFGQSWIEYMRTHSATGGQLPKVIASYNAGPLPVARWAVNDKGDPLLWMESVPYWETRYYVPAVMRNMWVYQGLEGSPTPSLTAVAEHKWPDFPNHR